MGKGRGRGRERKGAILSDLRGSREFSNPQSLLPTIPPGHFHMGGLSFSVFIFIFQNEAFLAEIM